MTIPDSAPGEDRSPGAGDSNSNPAEQVLARARDSSDPAELAGLAVGETRPEVLQRLAANPATPPGTLDVIVTAAGDAGVRAAAAENPNLPPHAIETLIADGSCLVRAAVTRNPNVTPGMLDRLAGKEVRAARLRVALLQARDGRRPGAYPSLSGDATAVLAAVAASPRARARTLERLGGQCREEEIRMAVAANPATPVFFLGRLADPLSLRLYGKYPEPSPAFRGAVHRALRQRDTPDARLVLQRLKRLEQLAGPGPQGRPGLGQYAAAYAYAIQDCRRTADDPDSSLYRVAVEKDFLTALHENLGLGRTAGLQVLQWLCADPAMPVSGITARLAAGETPPRSPETIPAEERAAVQVLADAAKAAAASGSPGLSGPAIAGTLETVLADAIRAAYAVTRDIAARTASSITDAGTGPGRDVHLLVRLHLADDPEVPAREASRPAPEPPGL